MIALPRKVLTPEQMGAVDKATIEAGIPGLILMENAAHRCVEYLQEKFAPLGSQRIVVVCGKGNNGGDGLAIARLLFTRFHPRELRVVLIADASELNGRRRAKPDHAARRRLSGISRFRPEMRTRHAGHRRHSRHRA